MHTHSLHTHTHYIVNKKLTVVQDGCSQKSSRILYVFSFSKNFPPLERACFFTLIQRYVLKLGVRVFRVQKSQNPKFGKRPSALCNHQNELYVRTTTTDPARYDDNNIYRLTQKKITQGLMSCLTIISANISQDIFQF